MRIGLIDTSRPSQLSRFHVWIRRKGFGASGVLCIRRRRIFAWVVWWNRTESGMVAWMLYIEALHGFIGEHRIGGRTMNWIFGSPSINQQTTQE